MRCVFTLLWGLLLVSAPVLSAEPAGCLLKPGPYLLVDDFLIDKAERLDRKVVQPQRFLDFPVVTSDDQHRNWQPWLTVIHDDSRPTAGRFRMWYNADANKDQNDLEHSTRLAYLESADGIHWPGTYRPLEKFNGVLFGASVIDSGPSVPNLAERYKLMYWPIPRADRQGPTVAFSPDGLTWTMHQQGNSILASSVQAGGDSWHAGFDPLRERYFLIGKSNRLHHWTNAEGKKLSQKVRLYGTSLSSDFKTWGDFKILFAPDEKDPGVTEWYAMVGFQTRGDLIVGFLQVLRDDLTCSGAPREAATINPSRFGGMGHTVLCWLRDGETWQRDRQSDAFLEPSPNPGWDHAMAWVSSAVPVGDELYLYYTGYRWGHKYRRSLDRQVGLVKMLRDRYVAREAGSTAGSLVTRAMTVAADALTLNVDASHGEVRVRVLDAQRQPISGFDFSDGRPITSDALSAPVVWKRSLSDLRGQQVRLEFSVRDARLFAFSAK